MLDGATAAQGVPAPMVSVVMPVRDEADHIARSLGAVLAQDWPADRLEVLVADGRSTDATRSIVEELARGTSVPVTVLDNPEGIVPTGLNRAIAAASGDIVIRVDGHCEVPRDYVDRLVEALRTSPSADCVGGVLRTVGAGPVAAAIAAAQSSRFGVGSADFRTGAASLRTVDTVAFGAYRRAVLDRLGPFDEELVRNQDDEFNLRLTQHGGTILLDPALEVVYHSRATLGGLWRQYFGYGCFKVRVLQKRGSLSSLRQLAPVAMVTAFALGAVAAVVLRRPAAGLFLPAVYGAGVTAAAVSVGSGRAAPSVPVVGAAMACMHTSYGVGFLRGLWRFRRHESTWVTLRNAVGGPRRVHR